MSHYTCSCHINESNDFCGPAYCKRPDGTCDRAEYFVKTVVTNTPRAGETSEQSHARTAETRAEYRARRELIDFAKTGAPIVAYDSEVTAGQVRRMDALVKPEFATGDWVAVESEGNVSDAEATPRRALPRMQTQPPWVGEPITQSDRAWVDNSPTYSAVLAARDEKHPTRAQAEPCRCPKGYSCERRCGDTPKTIDVVPELRPGDSIAGGAPLEPGFVRCVNGVCSGYGSVTAGLIYEVSAVRDGLATVLSDDADREAFYSATRFVNIRAVAHEAEKHSTRSPAWSGNVQDLIHHDCTGCADAICDTCCPTPEMFNAKLKTNWRPKNLNDFAKEVHADNQHWWHDPATGAKLDRNMGEMLMLVVSEIAECMEGERKDLMDTHLPHRKMAEVELADAVIRLGDIVGSLGGGIPLVFSDRVASIAAYEDEVPENKGEGLKRICDPLHGIAVSAGRYRPGAVAYKVARTFVRIERYAAKHHYDLWGAVAEKREYNKHRADHKPAARLAANGKKF